jgi:hypothetical protein
MRTLEILLAVGYVILSFFIGLNIGLISSNCPEKREIQKEVIKDTLPELTLENVLIEIIKNDIKHPLIVLKQVIWETGWLKCKNCSLDYNNLCGMGWNGKTYHTYNHWTESIQAYHDWQLKYYKEGDYYQFLENIGYATDTNYINKLKSIELND